MNESAEYWVSVAAIHEGRLKVPLRTIKLLHNSGSFEFWDPSTNSVVETIRLAQIKEVRVSPCPVVGQITPALLKGGLIAMIIVVIMAFGVVRRVGLRMILEDPHGTRPLAILILLGIAMAIPFFSVVLPAWLRAKRNLIGFEFRLRPGTSVRLGATQSQVTALRAYLTERGVRIT